MAFPKILLTTPAVHSTIEILSPGAVAISRDEIVPALYPGQPFTLRWHYAGLIANLQSGIPVEATVLSKDKLDQLTTSSVPYTVGGVSQQLDSISTRDSSFYRLGNNGIVLQAAVSGIPASFDQSSTPYAVVSEEFMRGFEWVIVGGSDEYRHATFHWKEPYTIAALFSNISEWVKLDGTATLLEANSPSGPWTARGTYPLSGLGPGRQTTLTFPERKQEWDWLAPVIWVAYGDLYRAFYYTVEFKVHDDFDNSYTFRTGLAPVGVVVSDRKFSLATGATAAMAAALICYAISWLVTPAPGSTFREIANGLGKAALDPPRPSKAFRKAIPLPRRMMKALGSFQPLAVALGEAALYARFENALYRIEARYLGAVQARDASAARLHRGTYNEATRQMGLTAARLSRAIDEAHSWLRTQQELEAQARKTLSRWSRKGLRRDQSGARSALDAKTAGMVETLIRSPKLLEAAMEGIEANLIRLRSAVMQASAYAARDRLRLHPRRHMS